ncbi:MAG: hypothetical protein KJP23_06150, partial [Deltaproteobacteria bacterium]|nr:hypothetical protein [Deltaproteobacteria bacterium]
FHFAPFMDYYRRGEYENAFAEALKFNLPKVYFDPMMRAAALGQLERQGEAKTALDQLLELEPDFKLRARRMIGRYVKVDDLVDKVVEGLQKAGVADLK